MKKVIALAFVAVMALVMLASCGDSSKDIVGKWQDDDGVIYEFKNNGECVVSNRYYTDTYTYTISGSTLTFKGDFGYDGPTERSTEFSIKGDTLTFRAGGEEAVLTRVAGNSGAAEESKAAVVTNPIVGTWSDGQGTIILESDGSIIVSYDGMTMTGTYTAENGQLDMELTYQGMTATRSCNYTLNGDKLSLESDEFLTTVLDRVG